MQAPEMRTLVFEGEVKADPFSSEESAAEVAIRHLSEYNFDIGDWNYPAYVETRERLLAEQSCRGTAASWPRRSRLFRRRPPARSSSSVSLSRA
jgi:hypothetical protein